MNAHGNNNQRYCCKKMASYLEEEDEIIIYIPKFREYGIPVHDGGSSKVKIHFCPWCGSKLPVSLRNTWFDELEKLGIEDWDDPRMPEKYKSDIWWKTR